MSPRPVGRTQNCGAAEGRVRLDQARAFLDVAELVGAEDNELATPSVATALAVLAGIAAADAACCTVLGRRARGQDHRQAVDLVAQVAHGGAAMSRHLRRLLAVKDDAHYGLLHVSHQRATAALRQARQLVDTAADLLDES
ncbi:hypothetical protein JQS43_25265 [Natronosporangium hydrolyticum]|uniref:Uncharacterized protein n=1 Tax=Natronosporangium hydrolyticum TaxID=2811111 RepID=A0A895YF23_9ACTN|nr:hypothetical protein [Natronosporangium hydrolyticum]QSB14725.1 hypothetical protein JQS43_25265 [Natronosporangium hydrolyticum]